MTPAHHHTGRRCWRVLALALLGLLLVPSGVVGAQEEDPQPGPGLPPSSSTPEGDAESEAGWAVQPAGPDGPGLRSAFTYNVTPGQTLRDSVSVSNLSGEPITFALYAKDAFNTEADGAFALLDDAEESTDVGSWVTLEVEEYTVPAGRRADIPFELTVPEDAAPGDHAGGILAANVDIVDEVEQDGVTLAVRQRVAARIYVRVAGPLEPALQIRDVHVDPEMGVLPFAQGRGTITYTVENVGNVRIESATETRLTGLFGRTVETLDSQDLPELLPGGSVEVVETWKGNPPLERLTAKIEVTSLDAQTSDSASASFLVWCWLVVGLLLLIAAALVVRILRKRRAARRATPGDDGGEQQSSGSGSKGTAAASTEAAPDAPDAVGARGAG